MIVLHPNSCNVIGVCRCEAHRREILQVAGAWTDSVCTLAAVVGERSTIGTSLIVVRALAEAVVERARTCYVEHSVVSTSGISAASNDIMNAEAINIHLTVCTGTGVRRASVEGGCGA